MRRRLVRGQSISSQAIHIKHYRNLYLFKNCHNYDIRLFFHFFFKKGTFFSNIRKLQFQVKSNLNFNCKVHTVNYLNATKDKFFLNVNANLDISNIRQFGAIPVYIFKELILVMQLLNLAKLLEFYKILQLVYLIK